MASDHHFGTGWIQRHCNVEAFVPCFDCFKVDSFIYVFFHHCDEKAVARLKHTNGVLISFPESLWFRFCRGGITCSLPKLSGASECLWTITLFHLKYNSISHQINFRVSVMTQGTQEAHLPQLNSRISPDEHRDTTRPLRGSSADVCSQVSKSLSVRVTALQLRPLRNLCGAAG